MENPFNGQQLKKLRISKGWTIYDMPIQWYQKFGYRITPQAISNWERGVHLPQGSNIFRLAELFNVQPAYFFEN